MEKIHDLVAMKMAEIKNRNENIASSMTDDNFAAVKVKAYNATRGDKGDCPDCFGRGQIAVLCDGEMQMRLCRCEIKRQAMVRIKQSGLSELYEAYRLDNFDTPTEWQRHIKEKATEYLAADSGWLFVCGRSGSGKSHITCAVARELLEAGMDVRYMMWREEAPKLKAMVNEREEYERRVEKLTGCAVLVIDDLFKGRVTDADINLAFELLNARYNQPSKRTIISAEHPVEAILQLDEAVGSRIIERSRGFVLQTGDVNLRLEAV